MAIRIPILTSFDPKGLKQANAQFAKLQGSIGSLGRNFAVAGVAIAAAGAMIAKNAQSLARIERITAQTESVLKSTGTTANGTAKDIENLAGSLEALTATEAETIQQGANLLLTFKNIQNQAGAGNDIFNQTTAAMVDVARAMGTDASTEAIRLGKALNDPIKGISALSRVGIQFTENQRAQIKALQESGDLMGAQKIILAELQSQFGGSGAAFAKTFTGQLELMGHELGTIGEEATMAVMPALQEMVSELRELIPLIGPQLKSAIESVDWKALTTSVVNLTTFFVEHGATLAKVVIGIFALNTAFKLMQVAIGISNVAIALKTWYMAQLAVGMTATTIATTAFSTALRLVPWVAAAAGAAALTAQIANSGEAFDKYKSFLASSDEQLSEFEVTAGAFALRGADILAEWSPLNAWFRDFLYQLAGIPKDITIGVNVVSNLPTKNPRPGDLDLPTGASGVIPGLDTLPSGGGGGSKPKTLSIGQQLEREATVVKKQTKLIGAGLSEGLAARLTSGAAPVKRANKALAAIQKNNGKLTKNLRKMEKNLATSTKVAVDSVSEQVEVIQDTSVQDALDAKERAYQSFADSVKNTFASIKNSILGAFDLTQLGGSTNAITRNMDKLLVRLRSFATNVSKLSGMGLNASLLQQVISAGPMAGARLAESLVMGGTGALAAINAGYSEFGLLSGQIAQTGTEAMFNRTEQGSVYNINVDGGVGSGATIGKAIVDAIKAYERTSGAVFQGA
jgi:hypothetical protein